MATQSVSFGQWVDPQQQAIDRQRKLAEALEAQSMAPIPQQEAGGRVVPYAWTQGLAKMVQALQANRKNAAADEQQIALRDQQQAQTSSELQGIIGALRGSPAKEATPEVQGNNPSAYVPAQPAQEATKGDPQEALRLALMAKSPMAQQLASTLMTSALPKPAEWKSFEKPNADGSVEKGVINMNAADPVATFRPVGTAPVKQEFVNGQGVNPYTATTMGTAIPKQPDAPNVASDLLIPDGKGGMIPNAALIDAKKQIARSGASSTNVTVDTAAKPFLTELGKGAAEQVLKDQAGARSAQQAIANANQIEAGLKNVIAGPAAGARIKLTQIGQMLGVTGKDATEMLQNTRSVMQGLSRQELAAAGQMSGQGAIAQGERAILQRAESGDISDMTVPELQTLVSAIKKTAGNRLSTHTQNMQRLRKDPKAAAIVDYMEMPQQDTSAPQASGFKILGQEK